MKFLAAPGPLIAPPNDDIVYEVKLYADSDSIGVLDEQIGFTVPRAPCMLSCCPLSLATYVTACL